MEQLSELLDDLLRLAGVLALLGGAISYAMKKLVDTWIKNKFDKELEQTKAEIKSKFDKELEQTKAELRAASEIESRYSKEAFTRASTLWGLISEGLALVDNIDHGHHKLPQDKYLPDFANAKNEDLLNYLESAEFEADQIQRLLHPKTESEDPMALYIRERNIRDDKKVGKVCRDIRLAASESSLFLGDSLTNNFVLAAQKIREAGTAQFSSIGTDINIAKNLIDDDLKPLMDEIRKEVEKL